MRDPLVLYLFLLFAGAVLMAVGKWRIARAERTGRIAARSGLFATSAQGYDRDREPSGFNTALWRFKFAVFVGFCLIAWAAYGLGSVLLT